MWTPILFICATLACVNGHGKVINPPSRSSAWRYQFPTPVNYDDDGLNCGGYATQHERNGGRCGICGDAFNIPPPRPNEIGGLYGIGVIVRSYPASSTIAIIVELTTSHLGYWEFKLCTDPNSNEQSCFDKYVLELEDGGTKYYPTKGSTKYEVAYKLPKDLTCEHCVLQWRYTTGNNWGVCGNGTQGLGCGPQEQFGACSDITIFSKDAKSYDMPLINYLSNGYLGPQQGATLLRGLVRSPQSHNKGEWNLNTNPRIITTEVKKQAYTNDKGSIYLNSLTKPISGITPNNVDINQPNLVKFQSDGGRIQATLNKNYLTNHKQNVLSNSHTNPEKESNKVRYTTNAANGHTNSVKGNTKSGKAYVHHLKGQLGPNFQIYSLQNTSINPSNVKHTRTNKKTPKHWKKARFKKRGKKKKYRSKGKHKKRKKKKIGPYSEYHRAIKNGKW